MYKIYKLYINFEDNDIKIINKLDYLFVIESDSNNEKVLNKCSKTCKKFFISSKRMLFEVLKKEKKFKKNSLIGIIGCLSVSLIDEYTEIIKFYFEYENAIKRISKKMDKYNCTLIKDNDNFIIKDAVDKFTFHNCSGKYVRAFLIILGYMYNERKNDLFHNYADSLAIAYETFQTSILVHDDIIDSASVRRGKMTIPKLYEKDFLGKINDKDNISNSLAICLADLGFYEANELIVSKYGKDKNFSKLISYYNNIVLKTIKGEIIDVYLPFKGKYMDYLASFDDVIEISKLKTSWYTIVGPFCLGLILSSASNKKVKQFEEALIPLGIAFQIKDDIMGVFNSSANLGKDSNDISEFKQTLLYHYAINSDYKDELLKYYGKEHIDSLTIENVKEIFIKSNAYEKTVNLMNTLFNESKEKLKSIKMPKEFKDILFGFISYLEIREK